MLKLLLTLSIKNQQEKLDLLNTEWLKIRVRSTVHWSQWEPFHSIFPLNQVLSMNHHEAWNIEWHNCLAIEIGNVFPENSFLSLMSYCWFMDIVWIQLKFIFECSYYLNWTIRIVLYLNCFPPSPTSLLIQFFTHWRFLLREIQIATTGFSLKCSLFTLLVKELV